MTTNAAAVRANRSVSGTRLRIPPTLCRTWSTTAQARSLARMLRVIRMSCTLLTAVASAVGTTACMEPAETRAMVTGTRVVLVSTFNPKSPRPQCLY